MYKKFLLKNIIKQFGLPPPYDNDNDNDIILYSIYDDNGEIFQFNLSLCLYKTP